MTKRKSPVLIICFIVTVFSAGNSFAMHPLVTDDPETQGLRKSQIEFDAEYSHNREEGSTQEEYDFKSIYSYGVARNADIVLTVPYVYVHDGTTERGLSDVTAEVKWRFYENGPVALAVKPGISIPAGEASRGLGTGRLNYSVSLIGGLEERPWTFYVNAGYVRASNPADEDENLFDVSLAATYELKEDVLLVGNIGTRTNPARVSVTPDSFILGGIVYSVTRDIDIDLGVKGGIGGDEPDYQLLSAFTRRF